MSSHVQSRALETRARLLDAGRVAFSQRGYDAVNLTTDILEPAGVSVGSFYHQFTDKTDLLIAILDDAATNRKASVFLHGSGNGRKRSLDTEIAQAIERFFDSLRRRRPPVADPGPGTQQHRTPYPRANPAGPPSLAGRGHPTPRPAQPPRPRRPRPSRRTDPHLLHRPHRRLPRPPGRDASRTTTHPAPTGQRIPQPRRTATPGRTSPAQPHPINPRTIDKPGKTSPQTPYVIRMMATIKEENLRPAPW